MTPHSVLVWREIANDLELVSANIGRVETNIAQLRTDLASMETNKTTMTNESMHFEPAPPAIPNSNASSISSITIQPILQDYAERRRDQMAQPLSEAFEDGFELLSRKAKRLKHIGVNPENYQVEIGMAELLRAIGLSEIFQPQRNNTLA